MGSAQKPELVASSLVGLGDEIAAHRAYRGLGIASLRVEILRFIVSRSQVCTADVMREFGITRNGARLHLHGLSEQDLIVPRHATHPRGSGPITYWEADRDEVEDLFEAFAAHVFGRPARPA